ncbi:hypothetical protein EXIGLDRAFT_733719 [Exidia glandulosa HHB12029]|uniref:Uncharacterized protein n=1 Tax=Exidia glandulosa HHB12029 TaxID=1314781 RepID=A0A165B7V6_EXIGL|nr:hypothetical protein EXIGLDRAFT_733719 [Exidia glandulosa HHB12029]
MEAFNGLHAEFGLRGFNGQFGQCYACGYWVKLPNLAVHAERTCNALKGGKYWDCVAKSGDARESGGDSDGEEDENNA